MKIVMNVVCWHQKAIINFHCPIVDQITITHIHFAIESLKRSPQRETRQPKTKRNMIIQKRKVIQLKNLQTLF